MHEMTLLEELECTYCEMHKDVYGVKARWYRAESVEQARRDIEVLSQELDRVIEADRRAQALAIQAFQEVVDQHCQGDLEAAKRWQHQAYNTDGTDDHLEYCLGLPYGYFRGLAAKQGLPTVA